MGSILRAIAAAWATITTAVWEVVDGTLQLVRKVLFPPPAPLAESEIPVSDAERIAKAFEKSHAEARQPGREGVTYRHPLGIAVGMAARGYSEHLADVPDDIAVWLHSLTDGEREVLVRLAPDQIEQHVCGERMAPGLPGLISIETLEKNLAKLDANSAVLQEVIDREAAKPSHQRRPRRGADEGPALTPQFA